MREEYRSGALQWLAGDLQYRSGRSVHRPSVYRTAGKRLGHHQHGRTRPRLRQYFYERHWRSVKYEDVYLNCYETVLQIEAGLNRSFCSTTKSDLIKVSTTGIRLRCILPAPNRPDSTLNIILRGRDNGGHFREQPESRPRWRAPTIFLCFEEFYSEYLGLGRRL